MTSASTNRPPFDSRCATTGKKVCLQRPVDVMQSKRGDDQFEGPFRQSILEAAKSQLCSRAQNLSRRVQLVPAFIEAHSGAPPGAPPDIVVTSRPCRPPGQACGTPLDPLTRERFPAALGHTAVRADSSGAGYPACASALECHPTGQSKEARDRRAPPTSSAPVKNTRPGFLGQRNERYLRPSVRECSRACVPGSGSTHWSAGADRNSRT